MSDPAPILKARTSICIRWSGRTLKLAWINEDAQGVYFGIYGHPNFHASYHSDGKVHFKGKGRVLLRVGAKTPPSAIEECEQLCVSAVPLSEEALNTATSPFRGDKQAVEVFISPGIDIAHYEHLNIDIALVNSAWEEAYVERAQRVNPDRVILSLVLVPMVHLPRHKVAMTVFGVPNCESSIK